MTDVDAMARNDMADDIRGAIHMANDKATGQHIEQRINAERMFLGSYADELLTALKAKMRLVGNGRK